MSDEPKPAPMDPYATSDKPSPPVGASTASYYPDEEAGATIGRYKLLQKLDKGGMGVVWMAEQRANRYSDTSPSRSSRAV